MTSPASCAQQRCCLDMVSLTCSIHASSHVAFMFQFVSTCLETRGNVLRHNSLCIKFPADLLRPPLASGDKHIVVGSHACHQEDASHEMNTSCQGMRAGFPVARSRAMLQVAMWLGIGRPHCCFHSSAALAHLKVRYTCRLKGAQAICSTSWRWRPVCVFCL